MNKYFLLIATLQYAGLMVKRSPRSFNINTFSNIPIFLVVFCLIACNSNRNEKHDKFDKIMWATIEDKDHPYRDKMLDDLIKNHLLHGLKKSEVEDLIGQPNRTDSLYLFYTITQKRLGILPLYTKTLVIKLTKDSTLEWEKDP